MSNPETASAYIIAELAQERDKVTSGAVQIGRLLAQAEWHRARIAELEDERDRLADALNDNPDPLVSSLQSQVQHFRDLTAEILAEVDRSTRAGRTLSVEDRLAEWRRAAGLESR